MCCTVYQQIFSKGFLSLKTAIVDRKYSYRPMYCSKGSPYKTQVYAGLLCNIYFGIYIYTGSRQRLPATKQGITLQIIVWDPFNHDNFV